MGVVGRCAAHRTPARRYSTLSDFAAACYLLAGAPRAPSARRTYGYAVAVGPRRALPHPPRRHLLVILPPRTLYRVSIGYIFHTSRLRGAAVRTRTEIS